MRLNLMILFTVLGVFISISFLSEQASARSSGMVSVTNWNEDCCPNCEDIEEWNNMISRWFINVGQSSEHGSRAFDDFVKSQVDGYINEGYLLEKDPEWNCDSDSNWIDLVGIAIVGMHGAALFYYWGGKPRTLDSCSNCTATAAEMAVGNLYSINLVLSSCDSVDKKYFLFWSQWKQLFAGIHQLNGFFGYMWISSDYRENYRMFADDGFDIPLKTSFYENLYIEDIWDDEQQEIVDQCPVSVSAGEDVDEAIYHRDNFYYYSWGSDPDGNDYWARWGVSGCVGQDEGIY